MYRLFPKAKAYLIAGCGVTFLFVGTLVHDRAAWHVVAMVAVCGAAASWLFAELYATAQHHKLLLILYGLLNPCEFIARYEPFLETQGIRSRVRLTLLAYLSNGYAALGDFARAEQLLDDASTLSCEARGDGNALLAGNRCAIQLSRGDASSARNHLDDLKREIAGMPSGKKRRAFEETGNMLSACAAIAERRCTHNDIVFLERRLKRNTSRLYGLELKLWLARAHLALGESAQAAAHLEPVSVAGGNLRIGQEALKLMKECGNQAARCMDNPHPSF